MEEKAKANFSSGFYYEIGLIAYSLGLNTSFFLFKSLTKSGPAFIVSYMVFVIVVGIPYVILEMSLSQYGQKGMIDVWEMCPAFKGLGYYYLLYSFIHAVTDIRLAGYIIRYTKNTISFSAWNECNNPWNTEYCFTSENNRTVRIQCINNHGAEICNNANWRSSFHEYFFYHLVRKTVGILEWNSVYYCLGIVIVMCAIQNRRIPLIEKVVLMCLILAAFEFFILMYLSLMQIDAWAGITFLFQWSLKDLSDVYVWKTGFSYAIYSLRLNGGGLATLGAENHFRGNSYMNGMMIALINVTVTMLYASLYSILCSAYDYQILIYDRNYMFYDTEHVLFSKIPRLLEVYGRAKVWQFLCYSNLLFIHVSNVLLSIFIIKRTIFGMFPKTQAYPKIMNTVVYLIMFLCVLPQFSEIGVYIYLYYVDGIMKENAAIVGFLLKSTFIVYVYGLPNAIDDIHFMLGFRMPVYWQSFIFFGPLLCLSIVVGSHYQEDNSIKYLMDSVPILKQIKHILDYQPAIVTFGYLVWTYRKMIWKRKWVNLFKPSEKWLLDDPVLRKSRQMFSSTSVTKEYLYRQSKRKEMIDSDFSHIKVEE